jgi:hypothetical protein
VLGEGDIPVSSLKQPLFNPSFLVVYLPENRIRPMRSSKSTCDCLREFERSSWLVSEGTLAIYEKSWPLKKKANNANVIGS